MVLRVTGKNLDIGEALRTHVQDRIEAAVAKYFDGSVTGHVVIEREGPGYRADCTLHLASGITLQSDGRAQEPYASFDQASERMEKRLRRYKRRLKDHHVAQQAGVAEKSDVVANYVIEAPNEDEEENEDEDEGHPGPAVIAETRSTLKSLPVSAAVAELDMTGAAALAFRHAGNGRVNVVYRRRDGNIGWIDPSATDGR